MTRSDPPVLNFASDNVTGAHPRIVAALAAAAGAGPMASYGADPLSDQLTHRLAEVFDHQLVVFPVISGTAANALALSALTPPWGTVLAQAEAHIEEDECGAVELLTGGARILPVAGDHGKITTEALAARLAPLRAGDQHQMQPAAISLSQATEAGTVYRPEEVAAIGAFARERGLGLHMDGARFANALVHLGCHPADLTWRAGVDVLSFGATKNGALAAEAVVFFNPERAADFKFRRKRAGHLVSKMRFLSAQLLAYLDDGLWLDNAAVANQAAARLSAGLAALPGARLAHPVEANEIFIHLPERLAERLLAAGAVFYPWGAPAGADGIGLYRFVTAFNSETAAVDQLIELARALASENP